MENQDRHQIGELHHETDTEHEPGRMDRVRERTRETIERAKGGLSAGAAAATELGKNAATGARERAVRAAEIVRDAETNVELQQAVSTRTESSIDRAGDAVSRAAPTIGRGTEKAAEMLGQALHAMSHPTGALLGTVAGTLGGWWRKAAEDRLDMPKESDAACRDHFMRIAAPPPGLTYENARPAYALGYVASQNPDYRGRSFDELEPEFREGIRGDGSGDYESLRDFTRFGYDQGSSQQA